MKKNTFKRFIAVVLCFCIFGSSCIFASAADDTPLLSIETASAKKDYQKGETAELNVTLRNNSLADLGDVLVWYEYDASDTFLVPAACENVYKDMTAGSSDSDKFKLNEIEIITKIGESAKTDFGRNIVTKLIHFYGRLVKAFELLKMRFTAFPKNLFTLKTKAELGSYSINYNGTEVNVTFYAKYKKNAAADVNIKELGTAPENFEITGQIKTDGKNSGIVFSSVLKENGFDGNFFYINGARKTAGLFTGTDDVYCKAAEKKVDIVSGKAYDFRLQYADGRLKAYLYNNPLDTDTYPLFDVFVSGKGEMTGICGDANNVIIQPYTAEAAERTYTNPVYPNSADPFILKDGDIYYLYATNSGDGFIASKSTDLVNWTSCGLVAKKGDIYGDYYFWAPEVYKYNGRYYLLYTAEEHIALAVADSPAGPFRKTSDGFLIDRQAIDGHFFFDDDGKVYFYYAGEGIMGCEMNSDLLTLKTETLTCVLPDNGDGWAEGPFVLKHNGTYYLTYSGNDYQRKDYRVSVATASAPLNKFKKDEINPILTPDTFICGTGHHSFVYSPDVSELFIAYHSHLNDTTVHPRPLCIDRVKFVPTESGTDALVIYGPTKTPQKYPQ